MGEADVHHGGFPQMPAREATLRNSTAVAGVRATWSATFCRLTPTLWCSVSTIAPIMAVSRIRPAAWKKKKYWV